MRHQMALATIGAVLLAAYPAVAAAKDYQLPPSSKWIMDYAPDSCRLLRSFGTGDDKLIVQFIQYEPGPGFDFDLIGKPIGRGYGEAVARLRFGAIGDFVRTEAMTGSSGDLPALFLSGRLDNFDPRTADMDALKKLDPAEQREFLMRLAAAEAAVTSATVRVSNRTIVLELGPMGPPMAQLRKCTTDLVKLWGLDPAEQEALASRPKAKSDQSGWLRSSDYPHGALETGQQAIVRYRLMISATGQVTGCAIQSAIAKGNFAKVSCDLLTQRARFEPAVSANGAAVPSYIVGKVRWVVR